MKNRSFTKRMPILYQMTIGFSVPVILITLIFAVYIYPRLENNMRLSMQQAQEQNCRQIGMLYESYFSTMADITSLLAEDESIAAVIGDADFLKEHSNEENYMAFHDICSALERIASSFTNYSVSIYLPDSVPYVNNRVHVCPESDLMQKSDYHAIAAHIDRDIPYITIEERKDSIFAPSPQTHQLISIYGAVPARDSREAAYVARVDIEYALMPVLTEEISMSDGTELFILDEEGRVLLSNSRSSEEIRLFEKEAGRRSRLNEKSGRYYITEGYELAYSDMHLVLAAPVAVNDQKYMIFRVTFLLFALLIIGSILLVSYMMARRYTGRLSLLSEQMQLLEKGNLNVQLPEANGHSRDEIDQISHVFNYMMTELHKLMQDHYKMGKDVKNAELKALQAQINPHFLYNTLDLINWTAMDYGEVEIAEIAQNMARFYRLTLNHGHSTLTIAEEIEHIQVYVALQNYHFSNAIDLQCEIEEGLEKYGCPNILLQPFVENAILHGIGEHPELENCHIAIRVCRTGSDICFTIKDDGPGITPELMKELQNSQMRDATKGYGVKNINFRLKLYFGEEYGLRYESVEPHGTQVVICIPIMSVEEIEQLIH